MKDKLEDLGIDLENFDKEDEIAKFQECECPLWNVLIRLYTEPQQTKGGLYIPSVAHDEQQYKTITGLVVKISPGAYKDSRYEHTGAACKVGDWVVIARHSGTRMKFKGMPVFATKEDAIELIVANPKDITR